MTSQAVTIQQLLAGKASFASFVGQVQSISATGFVVVVNAGIVNALPGSDYLPVVGEPVTVWFINKVAYVMGPSTPNAGQGTVQSVASGLVTLTTAFGPVTCPYASTLTPTAGQVMQLLWQGGPFAVAVLSTSPAANPPPSGGGGGATTRTITFPALDSGSYQSRWWTDRVYDSDSNTGMWFYGTKIRDTIPAGAPVSRVQMYVSPTQLRYAAPIFGLHSYASKPGGAPAAVSSPTSVGVGGQGWVDLPVAFGNALKSGGGAFGIGTGHGGYNIFASRGEDGQSGALRITFIN